MKKFIALLLFTALGAQLVNQTNTFHEATTTSIKKVASVSPTEFKPVEAQQIAISSSYKAPVAVVTPKPVTYTPTGSEYEAKAFIYSHESGGRTDAINKSSGACGLGQALPCSKMGCSLQDYACQDAWFTNYAMSRYGSWSNAQAFWLSHKWW